MNLLVPDQRITRGVDATLTFQYVDQDGVAADPGTVTVTISKADGTAVATNAATNGTGTNPRTYTLTKANNLTLELLTAVWQLPTSGPAFTTLVEVAGGFAFTIAEARASDSTLADTTKYPTVDIERARLEVEYECETICDVAFVPRYRRVIVDGTGTADLSLFDNQLRTIRSIRTYSSATAYTSFTASDLALLYVEDDLLIHRPRGLVFDDTRRANIAVEYEHGYDAPPPDLKRAQLTRLRSRLNMARTGIPDRATSFQAPADQGGGTYRLDLPGPYKTGIPEVDAVYARYSRRAQGSGDGPGPASASLDMDPQRYSIFHGPRR